MARIRKVFGKKKPAKPDSNGIETELSIGVMSGGCHAGTILPDGSIVRGADEPDIAHGGYWWPPNGKPGN